MLFETMNLRGSKLAAINARIGISLIGQSASAAALRRMVALSAATDAPLMITGALGSGKRDIAGAVHAQSNRSAAGFVAIHCETIDRAMLSGGLLDRALGGSVFFDEIGALNPSLFDEIRRILDARNLRVISATSQNADWLKGNLGMPSELYASLSVLTLPSIPLSQRKADIPLLIEAHIQQLPQDKRFTFDQSAMAALCRYDWPENLDEMSELIWRLSKNHAQHRVGINKLPLSIRLAESAPTGFTRSANISNAPTIESGFNLQDHLAKEEIKILLSALDINNGVIQHAANMAGVKRTTFLAKMKKYGIEAKGH